MDWTATSVYICRQLRDLCDALPGHRRIESTLMAMMQATAPQVRQYPHGPAMEAPSSSPSPVFRGVKL